MAASFAGQFFQFWTFFESGPDRKGVGLGAEVQLQQRPMSGRSTDGNLWCHEVWHLTCPIFEISLFHILGSGATCFPHRLSKGIVQTR